MLICFDSTAEFTMSAIHRGWTTGDRDFLADYKDGILADLDTDYDGYDMDGALTRADDELDFLWFDEDQKDHVDES